MCAHRISPAGSRKPPDLPKVATSSTAATAASGGLTHRHFLFATKERERGGRVRVIPDFKDKTTICEF